MKLRRKITLFFSLVLILTVLCADALMLFFSARNMISDARQSGFIESYDIFKGFESYVEDAQEINDFSLDYYFKSSTDDYTVCFEARSHREIFNNTVFSYAQLAQGDYSETRAGISAKRMSYVERRLLVYRTTGEDYILFRIRDLGPVMDKISSAALLYLGASALIAGISILAVSLLLRRSLRPLSELSSYASRLAGGHYSERLRIEKKDETGQLCSELNKMADAIERRTLELETEAEKRRLLMGSLTHELKTPLTAISGYAQTIQRTKLSPEDMDSALSYINSECMRLSHLSKKMMNLIELETEFSPELSELPLGELFGRVRSTCAPLAEKKQVELCTEDTPLRIVTDLELMTELLINLSENAIKASTEGGQVLLCTEGDSIVIEDFGCGIPSEEIPRITEPFYTLDRSRSRKNGGAGLGLSLAARITEKLGLGLKIESEQEKGTKITIYNLMISR